MYIIIINPIIDLIFLLLYAIDINETYMGKLNSALSSDLHGDVNPCIHIHYRLDTQ
jgi:hypothetical protein